MKQPVFSELVKYFWSISGFIGIFRHISGYGRTSSYEQRKQTRTTEQAKTNLYMKIHGIKVLHRHRLGSLICSFYIIRIIFHRLL